MQPSTTEVLCTGAINETQSRRSGVFNHTHTTMKNTILTLVTAIFLTATLVGCAKPPQQEVENALAALTVAEELEANLYVTDLYQAALDSFQMARAEIETENAKNAFTRNYDHAAQLLQQVEQVATEAQEQVATRKDELRTANEALFVQAEEAITRTQALLAQAPTGKDGAVVLVALQEDTTTASETLQSARAAQLEGNYLSANEQAQSALDQAEGLIAELEAAIAKTSPSARS